MQSALWSVEESVNKKFDHIHEQIGNSNTLQSAVLEAINGLRADEQRRAEETATRLGKTEADIETMLSVQDEHTARLDQLDNIEEWRTGVDTRLTAIEQADRDDIRTEIKNTNSEIASMKEMLKRYDSELRELVDRLAARGGGDEVEHHVP